MRPFALALLTIALGLASRLGGLVLGYVFLWGDLAWYVAGAAAAYAIERTAFPSAPGTR